MGKIRRVLRCYNCGAVLQSKKKNERGYIEPSYLNNPDASEEVLFCRSCHEKMKAINYGMLSRDVDDDILKILDDAVASDALILWAVDLFTFNGTFDKDLVKKIKNLKIIVIGTKFNLFPKGTKEEQLREYVENCFKSQNLNVLKVHIFGDYSKVNPKELLSMLDVHREGHDVYCIGAAKAGKSTFIDFMMKSYTNNTKRVIRTEEYPDTSVKVLEIPLNNYSFFYELPGFSLVNSVAGKVEKDVQKIITPRKEIKVSTRTLSPGEAIHIGSLAIVSFVKGKPTTFKFYAAEGVELKRTMDKYSEEVFQTNIRKRYQRPVSERYTTFQDFDLFEYTMENDGKRHDISITGLGWVSFTSKGQVIRVLLPHGTALKETLGKIK